MSRKPRVQRTPEEKWQIVLEGLKSGNVAETCRKYEIAPNLYYRWKDEVEAGSQGCAWGEKRSRAARCGAGEADQATGAGAGPIALADRDLKKRAGRVSCGQAHSSARELVAQGKEAKLVAETLAISRSSLYYQRQPRASRADRSHDQEIILACGEKPAYGYRRVVWWLGRHHGLVVNGKRVLRVMRERGLLVRQRRFQVSRRKDWGKVEAPHPNHVWQSDMTKVWAGPECGLGVSGLGDRLLHARDRGLGLESALPHRRSSGGAQPRRAGGFAFRFSWNGFDFDHRQRHAVYFGPLCRNPEPAGHHAPAHGLQPSRGQQLHRTVSSQLERRGGVAQRVPELRPGRS